MNHLFFPNRPKPVIGKAGINRVRKIIKYEKKQNKSSDTFNNNVILHNNIPNPWFYNKTAADKVWDGLEKTDKERQQLINASIKREEENEENENDPFFKIDKSTSKIRQLVDSFSATDQEFLLNLMEILDDDAGIDNLDQQSILLEAKLRLATMIDEHVGNSDAQSRMLDSLRVFFNDYQQGNQNSLENEMSNLNDFDSGVDSAQLANLINDACEKNEVCSEQASHIHKSIVDSFTRQMRDLRQEIDSRDKQIENLQNQIDSHQKNRRNRRSEITAKKIKETNQLLTGAQRKICEQQTTINNLKSALNKNSEGYDSSRQIDGQALTSPISINDKSSNSARNEFSETDNENGSAFLSSDREIELMSKIHYLTEQVQSLKSEVSNSNKEIKELKFASIDLNNNYQALERAKKTADQTISGLTEKYEFMENMYKKKIHEASTGVMIGGNEKSENQVIADLRIEYENKIASIKEQARQTQQQALDIAEKRHRMQMNDMLKSLENSDQSAALSEVMKNQENSISEVTERHKKQIIELKNMNNEKVRALTKQYEAKLMDAFKQNDSIRLSLKDDIAASLLKQKIELEAGFQKKLNSVEAFADDKVEKIRKKFQSKIDSVENLNKKLMTERDALRDAIEDAQIVIDIPTAEDELFDENEEEEEEFEDDKNNSGRSNNNNNNNSNEEDDDMKLFDQNLADQKIKKIKDEYLAMMNQQRENILSTKEWEMDQMKKEMMRGFEAKMVERRMNLVSDLTDLRDQVSNSLSTSDACEQLDNLISNLIKGVEKQSEITDDIINREPMIPLSEANDKMDELNKKIVQVSTENEFLRNTLGKLSNNRSLRDNDGNDVVKVMRQAVAEETAKINELLIENGKLKEELEKSKIEINELKEQKLELFKQNDEMKESTEKFEKEIELLKQKVGNLNGNSSSSFSGSVSLPIKPSYTIEHVSNDVIENEKKEKEEEKIVCSNCGEKISLNPLIMQVSTVEKPIVECPFCHEVVQVNKTNEESPFPKEEFNQQQLKQIEKMENEIKNEVMNLIEMKKKMRDGIDFSEQKQVITFPTSNENESKTITLTPNFDITVFTLPPNPKTFSIKSQKNSARIASARLFSPSSDRHFTEEQAAQIQQIEGEIDKKINSLVDIKVKFTSSNSSRKGSLSNLTEMNDNSGATTSNEFFFDSSEKFRDQIQKEIIKSSYSVVFEQNPAQLSPNKKGRIIAASKSCDIYHGRRVSFSSNLIKPPHSKIMLPNNVILQDKISDNQLKLTPSLKSKFADGYGGTSLDGSQNPFSRPLSDLINGNEQEEKTQPPLQKPPQESKNESEAVSTSPVMSGFPQKEEMTQAKLFPSNSLQMPTPKKAVLSKSAFMCFYVEPLQKQIVEGAHVETGGNVMARIQSQLLRSQQQQQQQTQQQSQLQIQQQPLQQQQQQQQQSQLKPNENSTFLTPQADIVSLQLSEVGYFSRRNSRPSSESQQRSSSPNGASASSPSTPTSTTNSPSAPDTSVPQASSDSYGEKLFVRNKPIGEPRAIEEFVQDLESWRRQTSELKEQYKSMMNSYNEVSSMTHDLVQRHNEVVKVLTKALDTAMSLAHGDAEHPEALIEKMQEQSAYLTTAIREKEVLHSQSNEHLLVLNERVQEVMQMHGETAEKEQEIEKLQKQLKALLEKEKQSQQTIRELEQCDKSNKENMEFQKEQINSMADKLEFECKKNFEFQKETDALKVKIETLQNQLVIASKEPDVDMTSIEPFVIFSFDGSENSPRKSKGFGLQPKTSQILPPEGDKEPENESESKNKEDESAIKENEKEKETEIVVGNDDKNNEVIHVASFKKSDSKLKDSTGSFSVFQPEFTDSNDAKVVYKTEDSSKDEEATSSIGVKPESSDNLAPKNDLSVTHPSSIGGRVVESQKAQNLKKRLKQLESALVEKVSENSEVKEELHTTQQHLFKLTNMNAKIEREMKKAELARDIAQRKLQSSIELITTLSTENESLRKLVEQYKQMAKKFAEDMKKASQFEESKNMALLNEMKTRSLLRDIQKVNHSKYSMKNIAERQAIAVARWEGKRRFMQQRERQKIFSALQALNLVCKNGEDENEISDSESLRSGSDSERERERNLVRKKSIAPGLNVAVYNIKKKQEIDSQIIDANAVLEVDRPRSMPSYDEALKNANSHNQKVHKTLKLGIVANPLKV